MSSLKNILVIISLFLLIDSGCLQAENIIITSELQEKIMQSSLKETLNIKNGKKIIVYLYASDEIKEKTEIWPCIHGDVKEMTTKKGHYNLYLYDVVEKKILSNRTNIFKFFESHPTTWGDGESHIFSLRSFSKNSSDILLISQFGDCKGNYLEAYGFNEKTMELEKYSFLTSEKNDMFYGRIIPNNDSDKLYAFTMFHHQIQELSVSLSSREKEILITDYVKKPNG